MSSSNSLIKKCLQIQTNERFAELFIEKSKMKTIVFSKKEIYIFNEEFKYYQPINGKFLDHVSEVLHKAFEPLEEKCERKITEAMENKDLDKDEKKEVKDEVQKMIKQINQCIKLIETTTFLNNVITKIISRLELTREQQDKLNRLENHLNFRNGKLDLKTGIFSERTQDDFITEYIDYDFQIKPNKNVKAEIITLLKKICNDSEEDYNFITSFLGYCITSETKEQKYLNVVGPSAGNGKSTLIKMIDTAIPIYVFKAKKDLFSEAYSKGHKYFSQTKNKRIVYIEEIDRKKIDGELMKEVVDGDKINNEVLYANTEKIDINFKLMFLSNNLMNFDSDQGIKRRMIHVEFKNKFVDKDDFEKEKENHKIGTVYPMDKDLINRFKENDDYKNALVHILLKNSIQYFSSGLTIPQSYLNVVNELCDDNDKFKSFFDGNFIKTNKDDDRLTLQEMLDMYNSTYKCNLAKSSLLSDVKRLQLTYDSSSKRATYEGKSMKGVIIGIKKIEAKKDEVEFIDDKPSRRQLPDPHGLDYGISCNQLTDDNENAKKYDDLLDQFEKLRLEFEEYKKQNPPKEQPKAPKEEPKAPKKSIIDFFDDEDDGDGDDNDVDDNKLVNKLK